MRVKAIDKTLPGQGAVSPEIEQIPETETNLSDAFSNVLRQYMGHQQSQQMTGSLSMVDLLPKPVVQPLPDKPQVEVQTSAPEPKAEISTEEYSKASEEEVSYESVEEEAYIAEETVQTTAEVPLETETVVAAEPVATQAVQTTEANVELEQVIENTSTQAAVEASVSTDLVAREAAQKVQSETTVEKVAAEVAKETQAAASQSQQTTQAEMLSSDLGAELQDKSALDAQAQTQAKVEVKKSTVSVNQNTQRENDSLDAAKDLLAELVAQNLEASESQTQPSNQGTQQVLKQKNLVVGELVSQFARNGQAPELSASQSSVGRQLGVNMLDGNAGFGAKLGQEKAQADKAQRAAGTARMSNQAAFVDKVKEVLAQAALQKTSNSVTLKVDPPHLGELTIKVTQKDGQTFARIIPESQEVENILKTKAHELHHVLQASGLKSDHIHVSIGRELSESETFQFSEFNSQQGEQNKKNAERSADRRSDASLGLPDVSGIQGVAVAQDSGWVA